MVTNEKTSVMKRKRHKDLQPWLDYFAMLKVYQDKGFLDVTVKGEDGTVREAYVTRAALMTMAGVSFSARELGHGMDMPYVAERVAAEARRIRAYAGFRSQEGEAFLARPFALHVVKEEEPHDLLFTLLLERRRRWWKLWRKADVVEVIGYDDGRAHGR